MADMLEVAGRGIRHRAGTHIVVSLLVAFTTAGYLIISSYVGDTSRSVTGSVEPLNFPYLKATVLFAYWSNPPYLPGEEFPPPREYKPVFNDAELDRIRGLGGVLDLSVALEQEAFSSFGHRQLVSIEVGAPMWDAINLVEGRLPVGPDEVLVPSDLVALGAAPGRLLTLKVPKPVAPRTFRYDRVLVETPDPEPVKRLTIAGVYRPFSSMVSGFLGYLPVRRVDAYAELDDPSKVTMAWPVPNTIFLHLSDPPTAGSVWSDWIGLYRDLPETRVPVIPPPKICWTPDLPQLMMYRAFSDMADSLFPSTVNAFVLAGLGVFSCLFLSFLDRRRELGILKSVGIDNSHTAWVIATEAVVAGATGTFLGIVAAVILAGRFLIGVSGDPIAIPAGVIAAGIAASTAVLGAATYIPRAMAKQGTALELLHGRPIPIFRHRR
jgi:hypothetical protein